MPPSQLTSAGIQQHLMLYRVSIDEKAPVKGALKLNQWYIKINLSQASNTTLIKWKQIRVDANALPDVAIIAFSTSTLPALTKEGIQHVVAVERELRSSNSRTFWTYQAFLVRKTICAYAGGRTSNYCIPATLRCLNNFEGVTKNLHTSDASCSLALLPASHAKLRRLRCLQLQRKGAQAAVGAAKL